MPREIQMRDGFKVIEDHPSCPVDRSWGVAQADGSLHPDCGCHPTLKAALKHMAEFFGAEKDRGRPKPALRVGRYGQLVTPGEPEFRAMHRVEFRVVSEADRTATIRVCTYNRTDDYRSAWLVDVWLNGLRTKLPKGTWAHDWTDIIGRAIDYENTLEALMLMTKFSDFDAVPRSRQAWTQLRDGDVDEFSFGFERRRWHPVGSDVIVSADGSETTVGVTDLPEPPAGCDEQMVEAIMHEWSPVLVGAVPGTGVLAGSVRSSRALRALSSEGMVDAQIVGDLAVQLAAGEIDLLGALEKIREAAGGGTLILSTPEKPKEPDKPAASTTEPSGEAPVAPVSDAATEMTEKLLEAVTAEAQAATASAEAATQAEADALILAADTALDGLGRAHRAPEVRSAVTYSTRSAVAAHDTAVVDKPWDGPGATAAMPNDAATLRYSHAWQDSSDGADPTAKSSYALPHHLTKGGPAVIAGVRNALARLPQTKKIPAADIAGVRKHLQGHLDKFNAK
jgi:ElaB/YqjD/DUF883 family membrane-anchored ribosome-binding protein